MKKYFSKFKIIALSMMMVLNFLLPTNIVSAEAHSRYAAIVLLDNQHHSIIAQVVEDSGDYKVDKYGDDLIGLDSDITSLQPGNVTGSESNRAYLNFPGVPYNEEYGSSQADLNQALKVMDDLTNSFNTAISFVYKHGNLTAEEKSSDYFASVVAGIANAAADAGSYGGINFVKLSQAELEAAPYNVKFGGSSIDKAYDNSKSAEDYILLRDQDSSAEILLTYSLSKGYQDPNDPLYDAAKIDKFAGTTDKISWKGIAWYALKAQSNGYTVDNDGLSYFVGESDFEKTINSWIGGIVNSISSFLGLSSPEQLMFNRSPRGTDYFLGMMPYSWFSASLVFYWAAQVISILVIFTAIIRLLIKRNLSIISPTQRASLKDGIMSLLLSLVIMALYIPLFYIMAKSNYMLATTFDSLTNGGTLNTQISGNFILNLISQIFFVIVILKLNVTYLVRAVTITILHIFSPVAIASLSLGNKKGLFSNWLKELFVNIFMQSMNALLLALYIVIMSNSRSAGIECMILVFSFIPLNKWIKDNLLGFRGVGSDGAADTASKPMVGAAAVGGTVAAIGAGKGIANGWNAIKTKHDEIKSTNPEKGNLLTSTKEWASSVGGAVKDHYSDNNGNFTLGNVGKDLVSATKIGAGIGLAAAGGALERPGASLAKAGENLVKNGTKPKTKQQADNKDSAVSDNSGQQINSGSIQSPDQINESQEDKVFNEIFDMDNSSPVYHDSSIANDMPLSVNDSNFTNEDNTQIAGIKFVPIKDQEKFQATYGNGYQQTIQSGSDQITGAYIKETLDDNGNYRYQLVQPPASNSVDDMLDIDKWQQYQNPNPQPSIEANTTASGVNMENIDNPQSKSGSNNLTPPIQQVAQTVQEPQIKDIKELNKEKIESNQNIEAEVVTPVNLDNKTPKDIESNKEA